MFSSILRAPKYRTALHYQAIVWATYQVAAQEVNQQKLPAKTHFMRERGS
jgi:hypothetical protein